jgi:hypothetical protein
MIDIIDTGYVAKELGVIRWAAGKLASDTACVRSSDELRQAHEVATLVRERTHELRFADAAIEPLHAAAQAVQAHLGDALAHHPNSNGFFTAVAGARSFAERARAIADELPY